jgi:hypothetical protein
MDDFEIKDLKSEMLLRLRSLNTFIRDMENFAETNNINIKDEKLYIAVCAQRQMLRDILKLNK